MARKEKVKKWIFIESRSKNALIDGLAHSPCAESFVKGTYTIKSTYKGIPVFKSTYDSFAMDLEKAPSWLINKINNGTSYSDHLWE